MIWILLGDRLTAQAALDPKDQAWQGSCTAKTGWLDCSSRFRQTRELRPAATANGKIRLAKDVKCLGVLTHHVSGRTRSKRLAVTAEQVQQAILNRPPGGIRPPRAARDQ